MSGQPGRPASPFGARLRQWRRERGLSQLGLVGCWAILAQARLATRNLQADLRHYVRHGTPSPRKQRQLGRAQRR